jgi:hypothetical protein
MSRGTLFLVCLAACLPAGRDSPPTPLEADFGGQGTYDPYAHKLMLSRAAYMKMVRPMGAYVELSNLFII